ncbi:hypothetical protein [Amycolatopsis azurea]|uniref:Uncharacterized protein n=1 Tax=Amycolatopsis azurea DSM 43854 TaxID=1238180 RepID=M2QK85_9PSEU|nr:hypothetical protein [Amycolatopsis azurea]EMD27116.1 hypothetical protein C791_2624 [Amycolatopsis azurea DSM 43854]OOC08676.1 hypothetical protein B0293_01875 [Amycolatopsis azurea DSM 43854]
MSKRSVLLRAALVTTAATAAVTALAAPASAAPGSATHNGKTLSASNATGLAAAGETITVTGSGFNSAEGYYVALCAVPEDYSYGTKPSPCAGGDGQGGTGVGPSAWVTNFPGGSSPIAANGTFTTQIRIAEVNNGLDCSNPSVTCAIISRRDHFASNDRNSDVFIPVSFS